MAIRDLKPNIDSKRVLLCEQALLLTSAGPEGWWIIKFTWKEVKMDFSVEMGPAIGQA